MRGCTSRPGGVEITTRELYATTVTCTLKKKLGALKVSLRAANWPCGPTVVALVNCTDAGTVTGKFGGTATRAWASTLVYVVKAPACVTVVPGRRGEVIERPAFCSAASSRTSDGVGSIIVTHGDRTVDASEGTFR